MIYQGDCLEVLKTLPDNSVDALVTDAPAGIQFMGLEFDHHKGGRDQWVAWLKEILEECYRVMKPGALGFVWSLPRTQHWTALACEDAGFLIWDNLGVAHVQGSGFPKAQDIGKMLDKSVGAEREVIGLKTRPDGTQRPNSSDWNVDSYLPSLGVENKYTITAPATPEAARWEGWKTSQLKPAMEFWVAIKRPHKGTVIDNIREWGVGGINVDAVRIGTEDNRTRPPRSSNNIYGGGKGSNLSESIGNPHGRYPANYIQIHSPRCAPDECAPECPCRILGEQSGVSSPSFRPNKPNHAEGSRQHKAYQDGSIHGKSSSLGFDDAGTAARYFHQFDPPFTYHPKASPRDRNDGTQHLLWRRDSESPVGWEPCTLAEYEALEDRDRAQGNIHATVKSTQLMEFFVKLVTPPGGTVLDPFMGSGTTGVAAANYGVDFIGIEREPHYFRIAEARINHALAAADMPVQPPLEQRVEWLETQVQAQAKQIKKLQGQQLSLFG